MKGTVGGRKGEGRESKGWGVVYKIGREGRRGEGCGKVAGRHVGYPPPFFFHTSSMTLVAHPRTPARASQDEMYHFVTSHAGATHGYAVRVWPFVPTPRPAASAAAAATTATTNQRAAPGVGGGVSCWYSLASLEHEVRLWYNLGRNQCFR